MEQVKKYFNKPWNPSVMKDETPLLDNAHSHLLKVYWTLCATTVVSAFGAYADQIYNLDSWITALVFVASIASLSKIQQWWQISRLVLLLTATYCFGASIGPLINFIIVVNQSDIVKVFVEASLFFGCYSASVLAGPHRVVIYGLADFLVTISVPAWMALCPTSFPVTIPGYFLGKLHWVWCTAVFIHTLFRQRFIIWFDLPIQVAWICFLRNHFTFNLCYLGLIYLAIWPLNIYMVAHSQESIYKSGHGDDYFVSHAIAFFTNFPALSAPRHMGTNQLDFRRCYAQQYIGISGAWVAKLLLVLLSYWVPRSDHTHLLYVVYPY